MTGLNTPKNDHKLIHPFIRAGYLKVSTLVISNTLLILAVLLLLYVVCSVNGEYVFMFVSRLNIKKGIDITLHVYELIVHMDFILLLFQSLFILFHLLFCECFLLWTVST